MSCTQQPASIVRLELEEDLVSEEERQVNLWRYDEFLSIGFESEQALALARDRRVELSAGRRLAALGCPPKLAFRILA